MNLKNCLISLILTLTGLAMVSCTENPFQTSKLPKEMPAQTVMIVNDDSGMSGYYRKIIISGGVLTSEMMTHPDQNWSAKITSQDEQEIYRLFVYYKFDLVKNDGPNRGITDVGFESVSLQAGTETYHKSYGVNSPMSMLSFIRFRMVGNAIRNLADKYEKMTARVPADYAIFNYDPQNNDWIFKNVKASALSTDEITSLQELVKDAVAEHNQNVKKKSEAIYLINYQFQYVPVLNEKGEKEVWVNSFCRGAKDDWRNKLIVVKDGGHLYFNLKINLTTKTYSDFMVNGDA